MSQHMWVHSGHSDSRFVGEVVQAAGGGMPVHPPLPPKATRHSERGFARWAVATAFVAALVLGMAVELLPTRAPEAGAVDAAAKAVDAVAVRMEAAAAQLQRLAQGDRS